MDTAIAVLTRKSAKEIIASGGSQSWVLSPDNARRQRYIVCCRNAKSAEIDADEPHGSAFLIGIIEDLVLLGETRWNQPRYRIVFSQCARLSVPDVWKNWRNPVRYTSLEALGIDPDNLEFKPLADALGARPADMAQSEQTNVRKLTIAEAKEGLAAALGISPAAIEIIIRS